MNMAHKFGRKFDSTHFLCFEFLLIPYRLEGMAYSCLSKVFALNYYFGKLKGRILQFFAIFCYNRHSGHFSCIKLLQIIYSLGSKECFMLQ